jgi:hypothetical protein
MSTNQFTNGALTASTMCITGETRLASSGGVVYSGSTSLATIISNSTNSVNPGRKRIIGSNNYSQFTSQLNFGNILLLGSPQINVSILCNLNTSTSGYVRLYASPSPSIITGATIIGQYNFTSASSGKTGYFKRTLRLYNNAGFGEIDYDDQYVEYVEPTASILSDEVVTTTGFTFMIYANIDAPVAPYLIAVTDSFGGFKAWAVEYGS